MKTNIEVTTGETRTNPLFLELRKIEEEIEQVEIKYNRKLDDIQSGINYLKAGDWIDGEETH